MIAVIHILGASVALLVVSTLLYFLMVWIDQKNAARELQDATVELGRPLSDFDSPGQFPELLRYLGAKYSDNLLQNRISDFFGVLLTAFSWLVLVVQLFVIGLIAWISFTEDQGNAVYAWFVLLIPVLGFIVSLSVTVLCKLLTGRLPGQAKSARKTMAEHITQASKPVA